MDDTLKIIVTNVKTWHNAIYQKQLEILQTAWNPFMRLNQAAIWFIAEHHLAYQACLDWSRDFLALPGKSRWKIHLNPAPKKQRFSGCAILLDPTLIHVSEAEGPRIIVPGRISSWHCPHSNLIPPNPTPITLIAVYLPYQERHRLKALLRLRQYLNTIPNIIIMGGDFNIPQFRMKRLLQSWGYAILGNLPDNDDLDYLFAFHREFVLPAPIQLDIIVTFEANWKPSDHPIMPCYTIPHKQPRPHRRQLIKWTSLKDEAVQHSLRSRLLPILGKTPEPRLWQEQKQIISQTIQLTLNQHRTVQRRRETNTQKAIQVVSSRMNQAPDRYLRAHYRRRLTLLISRLVALRKPPNPSLPFIILPDQIAFNKYTSRIPLLARASQQQHWHSSIEPSDMANAWKQAFYTADFVPIRPFEYQAAPDIPCGEALIEHLQRLPKGRTPGPDGINSDLYKYLPDLFAPHLTAYWRAIVNKRLPDLQPLTSNITMLYKKGNPSDPSNYRPISLLNTDLKLLTSHFNHKSAQHFDKWFGTEQQGFLPGRWIHWNTRFLLDLITNIRLKRFRAVTNIDDQGLILLKLDFKKAFDSVRWDYLREALTNLIPDSPELQAIVDTIYTPHTATILGDPTKPSPTIPVNNGVKQGDCASPILFNLALEEFLKQLRSSRIRGFRHNQTEVKSSAYADDTLLLSILNTFVALIQLLMAWSQASGVSINFEKSQALLIPPKINPEGRLQRIRQVLDDLHIPHHTWSMTESIDLGLYLGIPINTDPVQARRDLEAKLLEQMKQAALKAQRAKDYQASDVRLRSRVATSMISSIPIYYLSALAPTKNFLHQWKKKVSEFIYGKRRMRPADVVASLPVGQGGIKAWHPDHVHVSMAIYSLHKFLAVTTPSWTLAPVMYTIASSCSKPPWWRQAFKCAREIGLLPPDTQLNTRSFLALRDIMRKETHDTLYEKVNEWWNNKHRCKPPLLRYFPMRPRSLREWWRVPIPARLRDWGWLTLWGKNHGGVNSLRSPEFCHACNRPTKDWWHWAKSCVIHNGLTALICRFEDCRHWSGLSALYLWANALSKLGSTLAVDIKHVTRVSYLAYLCWWAFHYISEASPETLPKKRDALARESPQLIKRIHDGHYQHVLDWTQEQTPTLYGQGTLHEAETSTDEDAASDSGTSDDQDAVSEDRTQLDL